MESIWEFEIPGYRFTGGVIEIIIWEKPLPPNYRVAAGVAQPPVRRYFELPNGLKSP
jgi:hypothetical protein